MTACHWWAITHLSKKWMRTGVWGTFCMSSVALSCWVSRLVGLAVSRTSSMRGKKKEQPQHPTIKQTEEEGRWARQFDSRSQVFPPPRDEPWRGCTHGIGLLNGSCFHELKCVWLASLTAHLLVDLSAFFFVVVAAAILHSPLSPCRVVTQQSHAPNLVSLLHI